METQLSPTRFRILGSGMISQLFGGVASQQGKLQLDEYWDIPEWCGAFVAQHQLGVENLFVACPGNRWPEVIQLNISLLLI